MKKKIKVMICNLTLKQGEQICRNHENCRGCPLWNDDYLCLYDHKDCVPSDLINQEVEVDESNSN